MRCLRKLSLGLIGAALGLILMARPAHAADPHSLDITVSILVTKSLHVNTTYYDFGAMSVNTSSVSTTSIVVTNNSGGLTETYTIQGASATSTGGGTNWALSTTTGTDVYALAAQFSTARPADDDSAWTTDDLDYNATTATSGTLGNGVAGESGTGVDPLETRNLWFRIKTPGVVSDTTQHKATLTLAVL
jgi:hypothetical protein